MLSRRTDTVCDFPDPCTPHTMAEKGAFYDVKSTNQFLIRSVQITVFTYRRESSGASLLLFELFEAYQVWCYPRLIFTY
jgi:hypothetical protein